MKALKGGVDRIVHVNAKRIDRYTDKISSTPQAYCSEDLSRNATNAIPRTDIRNRVAPRPSQSRNQQAPRPVPRQSAPRSDDGKFAAKGGY